MPTLLVSLGTSPAIVPEAFLLPDVEFDAVHVLTTDSERVDTAFITGWFQQRAPGTTLTITRVSGFSDLRRLEDHQLFEEVLLRWWLEQTTADRERHRDRGRAGERGASHPRPHVCLSGGFKTMSAAMQKAAAVMGATEVFHVLCDLPPASAPQSAEEVDLALQRRQLHWVTLGAEPGWPQFQQLTASNFPLQTDREQEPVRWVSPPDHGLSALLRQVTERRDNIDRWWHQLGALPFATLATWSAAELEWLRQPVDPSDPVDAGWVRSLPKVELHCHLGGFATHGELLGEVRAAAIDPVALPPLKEPPLPAGWPFPTEPVSLPDYMKLGDANGSTLLRDPGCLQRQCELIYRQLCDDGVAYAEIRCSPANYADPARRRSAWQVLTDIKTAFDACMRQDVGTAFQGVPAVEAAFQGASKVEAAFQGAGAEAMPISSPTTSPSATAQPPLARSSTHPPADPPQAGEQPPRPTVGTAFQGVPIVQAAFQGASSAAPRQFIPFDPDAGHHQTWRDLPHRHQEGSTAFVTFRLGDSLPIKRIKRWEQERQDFLTRHPKPWSDQLWRTYQQRFPERLESWLDEAQGECILRDPQVAAMLESVLRHFDGERYILDDYVIMPNHVHVLVKPLPEHRLDGILHSWKSFSANEINRSRNVEGRVWEHESFDHLVRSVAQLEKLRDYIRQNPAKAMLKDGYAVGKGIGLTVGTAFQGVPAVEAAFQGASKVEAAFQGASAEAKPIPSPTPRPSGAAKPIMAPSLTHPPADSLEAGQQAHQTPPMPAAFQGASAARRMPAATAKAPGTAASTPTPRCRVNLIIIATRKEEGDYRAAISRHLALAVSAAEHWTSPDECRVVGVDLAGYEDPSTRAHYFREEFTGVHRCGLALTVHAGENDDAEGVWRAVFDLNARRLGHALRLIDSPELMGSVADRGIGVEMCPYANHQIRGFVLGGAGDGAPWKAAPTDGAPWKAAPTDEAPWKAASTDEAPWKAVSTDGAPWKAAPTYPLTRYLRAGVKVTVNTDNIGISAASLTDNLLLAARMCPDLTRLDLLRMLANGIDTAFLPAAERAALRPLIECQLPRPPRPRSP